MKRNDLGNIKAFVDYLISNNEDLSFAEFVARYITTYNRDFNLESISDLTNRIHEFQKAFINCVILDAVKIKENGIYVSKALEGRLYNDNDEWLNDMRRSLQVNHAEEVIRYANSILGETENDGL